MTENKDHGWDEEMIAKELRGHGVNVALEMTKAKIRKLLTSSASQSFTGTQGQFTAEMSEIGLQIHHNYGQES